MTKDAQPRLIIFAGANGSGKTTAAKYLLPRVKVKEFVNADEIARGLSPLNPEGQALTAGKLVLKRTKDFIARRESFAIETTLSGKHVEKIIAHAHKAGYVVEMHYIFCADIRINLSRIKNRVKQGGHHVPADDVRRRYWRSLANFLAVYVGICDTINVYDVTNGDLTHLMYSHEAGVFFGRDTELMQRFWTRVNEAAKKADDKE